MAYLKEAKEFNMVPEKEIKKGRSVIFLASFKKTANKQTKNKKPTQNTEMSLTL